MKNTVFFFTFICLFYACGSSETQQAEQAENTNEAAEVPTSEVSQSEPEPALPLIAELMDAHQSKEFRTKEAISFDIELYFGGKLRLDATAMSTTNSDRILISKKDGSQLIYDGDQVYISPDTAMYDGARFDMFTWTYFFCAPFKFNDAGTQWEALGEKTLKDQTYEAARLTFEQGIGDSPDDWYIAYVEPESKTLFALAYIVTLNRSVKEAEAEPHAISYHNYEEVEGIPIAQEWKFWMWSEEEGLGDEIGSAKITNVRFFSPEESTFEVPENSQTVGL